MDKQPQFEVLLTEKLDKISQYASATANLYLMARQKLAILEPLVYGEIPKLFDDSYGAHAHRTVSLALMLDLLRDIWAFTMDSNDRSPSVRNIWRLLNDEKVRSALRAKVAVPSKKRVDFGGEGWTEEMKERFQAKFDLDDVKREGGTFDAAFDRVSKQLDQHLVSDRAKRIDLARKKAIAHYEMKVTAEGMKLFPLKDAKLVWGDAKTFLDDIDPLIWDVVLLGTWGSYDVEGYDRMHKLYAADFWSRLQGKGPVEEIN